MSCLFLVSFPAAPEDTHEESVRRTVVSRLFSRRKNVAAESKLSCQEQNWLAESDLAGVRKSPAQLRLGAMTTNLFFSLRLRCDKPEVGRIIQ